MADTFAAAAADDEREQRKDAEVKSAAARADVAATIAHAARQVLELCKRLMQDSHDRQQIRDTAELTIEATGFARSADQVKAAALARLSALGGR